VLLSCWSAVMQSKMILTMKSVASAGRLPEDGAVAEDEAEADHQDELRLFLLWQLTVQHVFVHV